MGVKLARRSSKSGFNQIELRGSEIFIDEGFGRFSFDFGSVQLILDRNFYRRTSHKRLLRTTTTFKKLDRLAILLLRSAAHGIKLRGATYSNFA